MNKIVWTCWFQGRDNAPPLVQRCISSWEHYNPGWSVRCLNEQTARRLIDLDGIINTSKQSITAASLSDVLRITLLHEFGGVWVDATTLCNRALDEWLPTVMQPEGFFGFDKPARSRPIASWFLAAEPGSPILQRWFQETVDYWRERLSSGDYFWFHHLFRKCLAIDAEFAAAWDRVPRLSADGPHSLQTEQRMYRRLADVQDAVDWETPLFKLSYRLRPDWEEGSFIDQLLGKPATEVKASARETGTASPVSTFASLSVQTDNVGDHIQVIAADRLLARFGAVPTRRVDRDDGLAQEPPDATGPASIGLVLNGWFKRGAGGWPPHAAYSAFPIGLHFRPLRAPVLLSDRSLQFLRDAGEVGGRDSFTTNLLSARGVPAFESNCLTTLFPRRTRRPGAQIERFAVSRDERILDAMPSELKPVTFVNHYTGEVDFDANVLRAEELLKLYEERAGLIVTTLLHCALPAIAMGIPTIVFYPHNTGAAHQSDVERFSGLSKLVRIHDFSDLDTVDWTPRPIDLGPHKLKLLDRVFERAAQWGIPDNRTPFRFAPPARGEAV